MPNYLGVRIPHYLLYYAPFLFMFLNSTNAENCDINFISIKFPDFVKILEK